MHVLHLQIEGSFRAILLADKALSEEEKVQEGLKHEMKIRDEAVRALEEEKIQLQVCAFVTVSSWMIYLCLLCYQEHQSHMREVFERSLTEQKEEFARQQEQMQADLKQNFDESMREKERLLKEGFHEHAKLMESELQAAHAEQQRLVEESAKRQAEMQQQLTETMDRMTRERQESERRLQTAIDDARAQQASGGIFSMIGKVIDLAVPLARTVSALASTSKPGPGSKK